MRSRSRGGPGARRAQPPPYGRGMASVHQVASQDGTGIVYRAWGEPGRRVALLLHGWAQSSSCWGDGLVDALAQRFRVVAMDLRGHGYSDAPADGYDDPARWAGDVAAVLDAEAGGRPALLLGWSYGGLVIADYLAERGAGGVAGVVLVGAITSIGAGLPGGQTGHGMQAGLPAALSEVPREAIRGLGVMELMPPGSGSGTQHQALFGTSLSTAPRVRGALFRRRADHDGLLAALDLPVLLIHGSADAIVAVDAARHAHSLLRSATLSIWEGAGHVPFLEDAARFAAEVLDFAAALDWDRELDGMSA
jgi:non-heme chloroperoxidase